MSDSTPEAFPELFRYKEDALRLAFNLTRNRLDAEDAVQDAYLRAVRASHRGAARPDSRGWFMCIVANAARDLRDLNRNRKRREQQVNRPFRNVTAEQAQRLTRLVAKALGMLDEKSRLPLQLRYLDGLSYAKIAVLLNVPHATVRVRAARALIRLRALLIESGLADELLAVADAIVEGALVEGAADTVAPALEAVLRLVRAAFVPRAEAVSRRAA